MLHNLTKPRGIIAIFSGGPVTVGCGVWAGEFDWVVEPGSFTVKVGSASDSLPLNGSFHVVG